MTATRFGALDALLILVVVYTLVFGAGVYYMFKLMAQGPQPHDADEENRPHPGLSQRVLSKTLH